ncbi:WecB/TagA/CpsF family glycosyltransferase [uncultured Mucilaginibacter sp.]|uniref:WecB/TagA/CpsF family glycosyltransferase n=1 Tax=uncultured Mucilaginibacter sp. TaxID=797541 RepID=UPI00345C226F
MINEAEIITPDGVPISKCFKLLYRINQDRVDGMSMLPMLIKKAVEENLSVYFYGGSPELIIQAKSFLNTNYPLLNIAGIYSPPFRYLTEAEKSAVAININSSGANIVFVALGCPKQEQWMAEMKDKVQSVMIGIGGALPVFIGLQKRAPKWMQKGSLEWLYRLILEPKRLFKRYMITNSVFLWLLVLEKMKFISPQYRAALEDMNKIEAIKPENEKIYIS